MFAFSYCCRPVRWAGTWENANRAILHFTCRIDFDKKYEGSVMVRKAPLSHGQCTQHVKGRASACPMRACEGLLRACQGLLRACPPVDKRMFSSQGAGIPVTYEIIRISPPTASKQYGSFKPLRRTLLSSLNLLHLLYLSRYRSGQWKKCTILRRSVNIWFRRVLSLWLSIHLLSFSHQSQSRIATKSTHTS